MANNLALVNIDSIMNGFLDTITVMIDTSRIQHGLGSRVMMTQLAALQ